jgi:UDP-N-acetylglucosamine--N-acetylmuramyl-(pentapeptide) pyrophosphoryl-undecaprenol N-acetylglucosamine transferase
MEKNDVIALAAGGTGGHIFPAQALAEELMEQGYKPLLICDQRTNEFVRGSLAKIDSIKLFAPRPGGKLIKNLNNAFKIFKIVIKLRKILKKSKVKAVVGFGGYPSFPTMLAALSLGIPAYIHEQNAVLGRVNRLMAPFVRKIFLSFPKTQKLDGKYENKSIIVGNLVRKSILEISNEITEYESDLLNILVVGGSQGAKILSEVVPLSIKELPEDLQEQLVIYQQARLNLVSETKRLYKSTKAKVEVRDFFKDVGTLMKSADLVISRAGASTVTEVSIIGKPAIFIPLRIATDNHQFYNAKSLSELGGAVLIKEDDFNSVALKEILLDLLRHPKKLKNMAKASKNAAISGAAKKVVSVLLNS